MGCLPYTFTTLLVCALAFTPSFALAKQAKLSSGKTTIEKPLKVTGQTRTLSMMLVLKNKKDKSTFISPREHYRSEILNTRY
jgi:hypothetical protein